MDVGRIDLWAAAAAAVGIWMGGVTRIQAMLWGLAIQTCALALIAALHGQEAHAPQYYSLAGAVLAVKAITVPAILARTAARTGARRDRGALLNPALVLMAGCAALAAGVVSGGWMASPGSPHGDAAGMALTLLLLGMLQMLTRRLAIGQLVGFLVLENGIFLYALTQTHGMPLMIEMGVMLDVLVAVMVAGVVIFRINRSFEHIDVTQLRGLRD